MNVRRQLARDIRLAATELAHARTHLPHANNGEEFRYRDGMNNPSYLASFTKGLPHQISDGNKGLLIDHEDFQLFVRGIQSGDPADFRRTPLGPKKKQPNKPWESTLANDPKLDGSEPPVPVRAWESAGAGLTFDLQGPDAQAVTMPPAPLLDSDELIGEMAELYLMALMRDVPFARLRDGGDANSDVDSAISTLNVLDWFDMTVRDRLDPPSRLRHRSKITKQTLFRGITPGEAKGPYLSQFLLLGNAGVYPKDTAHKPEEGYVAYGSLRIDQRVRYAMPEKDYMTTFEQWVDVQNGANLRELESYHPNPKDKTDTNPAYRFITTPRDLATYVHYDALYEAYLNACLMLLAIGAPFDPGVPFQVPDKADKQQGFAQFGGPHILSLVTEVATRALKAVRYQKFNVHRRARPEAIGGLIHLFKTAPDPTLSGLMPVVTLVNALGQPGLTFDAKQLLEAVKEHNKHQNMADDRKDDGKGSTGKHSHERDSYLLPMAFAEGSPMHPAYGAGHATVAAACVTILKAFFDHGYIVSRKFGGVWEPSPDGSALVKVGDEPLTLEGELNKLAANIAIGRNWAGVHYFTDYFESFRLGEQVALGILEEQKLTYGENFTMTVPLFDGTVVRI